MLIAIAMGPWLWLWLVGACGWSVERLPTATWISLDEVEPHELSSELRPASVGVGARAGGPAAVQDLPGSRSGSALCTELLGEPSRGVTAGATSTTAACAGGAGAVACAARADGAGVTAAGLPEGFAQSCTTCKVTQACLITDNVIG